MKCGRNMVQMLLSLFSQNDTEFNKRKPGRKNKQTVSNNQMNKQPTYATLI